MAVAIDTFNNSGSANSTGSTFALTVSASATIMIIGQGERVAPSAAPSWNGSSTGVTLSDNGTCLSGKAYLYYLANPTSGTHNVVTTNSSGFNSAGAITFTGSATTITNHNNVSSGSSTLTPSGTCTSSATSLVVDYLNQNAGSAVISATGTGQTLKWETHVANNCAMSVTTGASTTTVSYLIGSANVFCMALVSVDAGAVTTNSSFLMFM